MNEHDLVIPARDGFSLAATLFTPGDAPIAFVVINSATAVKRSYYAPFARYLAEQGFAALTFDYRGIGGSRPKSLRGFRAEMREWASLDMAGAIDFAEKQATGAPLLAVGHSGGGWLFGFAPNADRVRAALFVGAQDGHWRCWPAPQRYRYAALWNVMMPGTAHLAGHLPGWAGIGQDLPKGVALEWAHWCRSREFVFRDGEAVRASYARVACPLRMLSLDDDDYAPPGAVDALVPFFPNARVERVRLAARDFGGAVGHFGFFRPHFRETLWRDAATWLTDVARR